MATKNIPKCPFKAAELQKWRKVLTAKLEDVRADITELLRDAMEFEDGHTTPTHQADRGTDVDMQDFSLNSVSNEAEIRWQIERAIKKIDTAVPVPFGICEHTLKPIPRSRLQIVPWTPLSIVAVQEMEAEGLAVQDMLFEG